MIVGMVLFWGLVIAGIAVLVRSRARDGRQPAQLPALPTAEQLLAERFAHGEIDENEYRDRQAVLRRGQAQP